MKLLYAAWIVLITGFICWVANIYQIIQSWDNGITAKIIFKMVGVLLAPLGAVLGLIGFF